MEFSDVVSGRRSVKSYDAAHTISDDQLATLFDRVSLSPSSFNLQHWRFVVVRDAQRKAAMRKLSYGQEQVENASACIVVVGRLVAHEDAPTIMAEAPQSVRESLIPMINGLYADNAALRRDEAIRSASLAAMTLMHAAYDMGYATGPLIGFDSKGVSELVGLDANHIPVMLVVLGKQTGTMRPRSFRHPLGDIVKLEAMDGAGLSPSD